MAAPGFRHLTEPNYGKPPKSQSKVLQELVKPHIESFNFMLSEGLNLAIQDMQPVEFALPSGEKVSLSFTDASIGVPTVAQGNIHALSLKVYPTECRQGGTTYKAKIRAHLCWKLNNEVKAIKEILLGEVPILVKSNSCNLNKLSPSELIKKNEEVEEMGGYFIINGIEKVIRMIVLPRRNFPMALNRGSWKNRGKLYTEYGVSMRCVKPDQTAVNIILHYLTNGTAMLCFSYSKEQFFVPVVLILKALVDTTDQFIYDELMRGKDKNTYYKGCVTYMLRQIQTQGLTSQRKILEYLGEMFRVKLGLADWYTDRQNGEFLIKQCICVHLTNNMDKFNTLVYMVRKLFAFANGECAAENADSTMNQEVLMGGHLYLMYLKEKMVDWLVSVRYSIEKQAKVKGQSFVLNSTTLNSAVGRTNLSHAVEYLLKTGNLNSKTGLGLMQATGLTVVADKLNYVRYLSHFRCIHRGAFFSEMRTTSVRRLLPEAWGFLCPVHTPDGAPCGLLNHMAALCQVVNDQPQVSHLSRLLCNLGMTPTDGPSPGEPSECYDVLLDGRVLGKVDKEMAGELGNKLRILKVRKEHRVPEMLEVVLVPMTGKCSQYPGLYLFSSVARLMRPVLNLATNTTEMIGTFEQVYMNIAVTASEAHEGLTTHLELSESGLLSAVASLTPFSDFNQSPRNMYQCQMGKQTMGTPVHTYLHRTDNKLYRLQTPQSPIVRPCSYDTYNIDNYPLGTNAVVAVISYTGYDMEDAMILNKSSYERGFAHGTIYKTEVIDLKKISGEKGKSISLMFGCLPDDRRTEGHLDLDGLPPIGAIIEPGDPLCGYINVETNVANTLSFKHHERAVVDNVKLCGNDLGTAECQKVYISLRIQRNPTIGDKFSSRHGQKGVCSQLWPVENMPFSESGMTPDIIFNPHGFPSRMTIGMMIESMAGKSGSLHGLSHDATPFTFSEDRPAIDYFGRMLREAGYNYYGNERMYSGVDGRELEADIFVGIVYYQRLRHMVEDKFQVRTTGPIDILTHQPVKGRKRAGGIRFGEMERDALLSHGTSFLLQDRLFHCSDSSTTQLCTKCGSFQGIIQQKKSALLEGSSVNSSGHWYCQMCKSAEHIQLLAVPYVFRYLLAELAAMSIKTTLQVK
ncbi:DNA-directed RNA polymerase I subunit RPA2-like [Saccoglossus kowalevskii]|uniref:DNA-directed RNA polymerase subunit beta n=1 Tax=Saccoglossus kowalevskii TaxID=10224 RepID=A0ABM0H1K0_SACKO|nr:PREDICTED: DNA-directed RNA polymerase I subunit RPA2-like [Saccoglossus kowalevskii]